MNNTEDDITLALSLADEAESLTMLRFTAVDLYAKTRLEDTPLIDAYHEVDLALRRRLALKRPQDTVFDETLRGPRLFAGRHWVIDPLDGRKNFIRGVPVWATLIALMVDGVPTVGVVSAPLCIGVGGQPPGKARSPRSGASRRDGCLSRRSMSWGQRASRSPACPAGEYGVCASASSS
jgi:3'-phosphoadenosine 5'-phosphosulfate (PAPS) 3'-phosphatase